MHEILQSSYYRSLDEDKQNYIYNLYTLVQQDKKQFLNSIYSRILAKKILSCGTVSLLAVYVQKSYFQHTSISTQFVAQICLLMSSIYFLHASQNLHHIREKYILEFDRDVHIKVIAQIKALDKFWRNHGELQKNHIHPNFKIY